METKKKENSDCCSSDCCKHPAMHCVIKTIVILIILGLIGMAGFACGARFSRFYGMGYYGMMSSTTTLDGKTAYNAGMMNNLGEYGFTKHMKFWDNDNDKENKTTKLFGTVAKVEGNKITVTDNAGKEQVVLSLSSTTISNSIGEIGLQSIKIGQGLSIIGKTNKDKQVEAVLIRIM